MALERVGQVVEKGWMGRRTCNMGVLVFFSGRGWVSEGKRERKKDMALFT